MINQTIRGTITRNWTGTGDVGYDDATISSVDTTKTQLRYLGVNINNKVAGYLQLVNSTTVRWRADDRSSVVSYELTEFT